MHNAFQVHLLSDEGLGKAHDIADAFNGLLTMLEGLCPESRELSLTRTKLEEACFFAKKAMASHPDNQKA